MRRILSIFLALSIMFCCSGWVLCAENDAVTGSISGSCTVGLIVQLSDSSFHVLREVAVDDEGNFVVEDLPAGTYLYALFHYGYISEDYFRYVTVTAGKTTDLGWISALNPEKHQCGTGRPQPTPIPDTMGTVSGKVNAVGALVFLKGVSGGEDFVKRTISDRYGNFTFEAVPEGSEYSVGASKYLGGYNVIENVTVTGGETTTVDISLEDAVENSRCEAFRFIKDSGDEITELLLTDRIYTGDSIYAEARLRADEDQRVGLYMALYDENGILKGVRRSTVDVGENEAVTVTTDSLTIPDEGKYIKLFMWDGDLKPLDYIYDTRVFPAD